MTGRLALHLINPNADSQMTADVLTAARAVVAPGTQVTATQAEHTPLAVETPADEVLGALAVAEQARRLPLGTSAAVLACFGDTGLDVAKTLSPVPVIGITEAALGTAAHLADHFAVITMPRRTIAMAEKVVLRLGLSHRCRVHAVDVDVPEIAGDAARLAPVFALEAQRALDEGAEAIVLGCAGLSALGPLLTELINVPVIDPVAAGVAVAEGIARLGLNTARTGAWAPVEEPPA